MVLLQLVWSRAYRKDFLNKNNIIIKPRYNDYSVAFFLIAWICIFSYSVDMFFSDRVDMFFSDYRTKRKGYPVSHEKE